jgi:hypothetical protein
VLLLILLFDSLKDILPDKKEQHRVRPVRKTGVIKVNKLSNDRCAHKHRGRERGHHMLIQSILIIIPL